MLPPVPFAPGLAVGQLYWLYGTAPQGMPPVHVIDPPCSGWGTVIVLDETETSRRVFNSGTLKSWVLPNNCYEMLSLQAAVIPPSLMVGGKFTEFIKSLVSRLQTTYAAHKIWGWESDYATAERILKILDAKAPTEEEWKKLAPSAERADKAMASSQPSAAKTVEPKTPKASVFKPVKATGRKGEVLAFFVEKGLVASRAEAMAKFSITSSNLLSQLFLLRKDHGIDYKAAGDSITLTLPEGVTDPFAQS